MKKLCVVFVLMFVLAMVSNANAEESKDNGNELLKHCLLGIELMSKEGSKLSANDVLLGASCLGTMKGVGFANIIEQDMGNDKLLYCIPRNSTPQQLTRVVLKYLKDHPEDLHENQSFLIAMAFTTAFPCKKEAKK